MGSIFWGWLGSSNYEISPPFTSTFQLKIAQVFEMTVSFTSSRIRENSFSIQKKFAAWRDLLNGKLTSLDENAP